MDVAVIIVAAGKGARAGGSVPKQYAYISNQRMLTITIRAILKSLKIDGITVVINSDDEELYRNSVKDIDDPRLLHNCIGGLERSDSVQAGLTYLKTHRPKKVLIHDAARPFVSIKLIESVVNALNNNDAVLPIVQIFDSLWQKDFLKKENNLISPGPNRNNLMCAQTPQGFAYLKICSAYAKVSEKKLDDIEVAYDFGIKIFTVNGEDSNYKITSSEQLFVAKGATESGNENR